MQKAKEAHREKLKHRLIRIKLLSHSNAKLTDILQEDEQMLQKLKRDNNELRRKLRHQVRKARSGRIAFSLLLLFLSLFLSVSHSPSHLSSILKMNVGLSKAQKEKIYVDALSPEALESIQERFQSFSNYAKSKGEDPVKNLSGVSARMKR